VTVAAGNINHDAGPDEVITGKAKGSAQVRVFADISGSRVRLANFLAYGAPFAGGVFVAAGDLNGDGIPEIITGPGAGTAAEMKFFEGDGTPAPFVLAVYPGFTGGVRVALLDLDHDGTIDRLVAAPGKGQALEVKLYDLTATVVDSFFPFDPTFTGGVFVGG
jgi:FG-GAP repeat protein